MHHVIIYLQQLQRCISGLFLVKRAAGQLEAELGYLQRKHIPSVSDANHSPDDFTKYPNFTFAV